MILFQIFPVLLHIEHQLTESLPPSTFSSTSAIKEVFDQSSTKSDEKGKLRSGKEHRKDVDEGDQAGGVAEESSGKVGSSKGLMDVIANKKMISELRDEVTFVDSNIKDTYKFTGPGRQGRIGSCTGVVGDGSSMIQPGQCASLTFSISILRIGWISTPKVCPAFARMW